MALEIIINDMVGSLNGTINSAVTSLSVNGLATIDSLASYTNGTFRIRIDSELMKVTNVVNAGGGAYTLTVTRGDDGTTAASHTNGAEVDFVLSRGGITQLLKDRIITSVFASLPTPSNTLGLRLPSDGAAIYLDDSTESDGSNTQLHPWGPLWSLTASPDTVANAGSWTSLGSIATVAKTDSNGFSRITPTAPGSVPGTTANLVGRLLASPATPYTITVCLLPELFAFPSGNTAAGFIGWGIGWAKGVAGTQPLYTIEIVSDSNSSNGALLLKVSTYTSSTVLNAVASTYPLPFLEMARFMRMTDNGTNVIFSISNNGQDFTQVASVARTTICSGTPDHVGYFINAHAAVSTTLAVLSWAQS